MEHKKVIGGSWTCEYCGHTNNRGYECSRCVQGKIRGTDIQVDKIKPLHWFRKIKKREDV